MQHINGSFLASPQHSGISGTVAVHKQVTGLCPSRCDTGNGVECYFPADSLLLPLWQGSRLRVPEGFLDGQISNLKKAKAFYGGYFCSTVPALSDGLGLFCTSVCTFYEGFLFLRALTFLAKNLPQLWRVIGTAESRLLFCGLATGSDSMQNWLDVTVSQSIAACSQPSKSYGDLPKNRWLHFREHSGTGLSGYANWLEMPRLLCASLNAPILIDSTLELWVRYFPEEWSACYIACPAWSSCSVLILVLHLWVNYDPSRRIILSSVSFCSCYSTCIQLQAVVFFQQKKHSTNVNLFASVARSMMH